MSRVDGAAAVQDIADLTNLAPDAVEHIVAKLVELGVAEWADGAISLPRASLRPPTPSEASIRQPVPVPRTPILKPHVTESQPPIATREPVAVPRIPLAPRRPSSPYLERASTTDTVETRPETPRTSPGTAPGARVHLRSSAGGAPSPPPPSRASASSSSARRDGAASDAPPQRTAPSPSPSAPPPSPSVPPPSSPPTSTGASPPSARPPAAPSPTPPPPSSDAPAIDLSPERRQRIDDLYPVLELMDHYQVLGLEPSVDLKEIRATYFALSKVFHPDTAFRKNLGAYKAKMEAIFTRLTEAYEVLGKKKSRAEYDAYLVLQGDARAVEAAMRAPSVPPAAPAASAAPPSSPAPPPDRRAPPASPPPARPSTAPPPAGDPTAPADAPRTTMSEAGRRRARELLEMRLGNLRTSSPRPPPPAGEPASASAPRGREEIVRDLASTLKGAAALTGGLDAVQRHLIEARRKEQEGDLASAARELRHASALAPERADVAAEQVRVSSALAAQLAEKYEKAAEYEERHKKWAAAALSWSKVFEGRPDDVSAAIRAATALVEAKGDLHRAQKLAQRACELAPESVAARVALGRVFLAAGLNLNARRELERAALLDPGDQIVKNLLREL